MWKTFPILLRRSGKAGLLGASILVTAACTCDRKKAVAQSAGQKEPPSAFPSAADGQVRGVAATAGELRVDVSQVESAGFRLEWAAVPEASGYEVLVGPEPPGDSGALPQAVRLATLDGGTTEYRVDGLTPDSHVFAQVRTSGASTQAGSVHVRLPRPHSLPPAGGLTAVHALGPTVLGLTILQPDLAYRSGKLTEDRGRDWQGGQWRVRQVGGAALRVRRVHRHSQAVGQGNLPLGYDKHARSTVHVEHRIYLELDRPLGRRGVFEVRHSGASGTELEVVLPFSDQYLETPVLQVNQVGYNPMATQRWAYVYGWLGDGGALDPSGLPTQAHVLREPVNALAPRAPVGSPIAVRVRHGSQKDVAGQVREIDLSGVPPAEGVRYRVHLPGVGVSYPTAISAQASFKAFYTVLRGLFHNRWCGALRPDLTEWSRPEDHCSAYFVGGRKEGFFPKDTERKSKRPLRGGHHDAGDFDIRPLHVLVAQQLLRAFELGGEQRFSDGQLRIPESGNGVPDLLDEALWSVAAWEQLQEADGSVRLGVESTRHPPGYYFAHEDELPYFAYDSTPAHTAYVAGLMAQASHLVRPYDPPRADRLLTAARRARSRAVEQGAPQTYLAYAHGEFARAAGEEVARRAFEASWQAVGVHGRGLFDHLQPGIKIYPGSINSQHPAMADFAMAYLTSTPVSPSVRQVASSELRKRADEAASRFLESGQPHRSGRSPGSRPDWGMESSQGRYLDGVYQALQLGGLPQQVQQRYLNALSLAADAMLGCNPAGLSYVTGLGTRSPRQPLHLDSLAFQKARGLPPIPGLVVYGPVESMPGSHYYEPLAAAFHPPFGEQPRALRHVDAAHAVNMSEFSVWESQAPAALLFAALLPPGLGPWPALAPGQPEHRSPLPPHTKP